MVILFLTVAKSFEFIQAATPNKDIMVILFLTAANIYIYIYIFAAVKNKITIMSFLGVAACMNLKDKLKKKLFVELSRLLSHKGLG